MEDKHAQALSLAKRFEQTTGKLPSRMDWRGENLRQFREAHGLEYPSERVVQRLFNGWGNFLRELGESPLITQDTAKAALAHVQRRYEDVELQPGASGTIDCFIGAERVEVKSSSLQQDEVIRTPRWRFRLHEREYSRLVDKMILVGVVAGEPVVEWALDKVAMLMHVDGLDTLNLPAKYPFNYQAYPLYYYETWKANLSYAEVLEMAA